MDLNKVILSDPINKWVFSHGRDGIYLVGGHIRDLIRGDYVNKDRDYILKHNVRKIAISASRKFKGTFIELKRGQTYRVALGNRQFLDFSHLRHSIVEDLESRDFRINAIAWSPQKGVIDPFEGERDLRDKIIRVIKPENLLEDPLRILRAYRIASQLGLTIDRNTRYLLNNYSHQVVHAAEERITQELFKLLITDHASHYVTMIQKDNVLSKIIGLTNSQIMLNLIMLNVFDNFLIRLKTGNFKKLFHSRILPFLNLHIGQDLNRLGLIRLSILLKHDPANNGIVSNKLRYSKSIMKRVSGIQSCITLCTGRITEAKLYDIFNATDDCAFEAALLISVTRPRNVDKFLKRADDFMKIRKRPPLDGHKIQNILKIEPSARIGKIQSEIQRRTFLGIIKTQAEARHWIISNLT